MLPEIYDEFEDLEEIEEISRTYKLDLTRGRIYGIIDNYEAVYQSIWKRLRTQEGYPIYFYGYGLDTDSLIGTPMGYAKSELERRLVETLEQDDRVIGIEITEMQEYGNELRCTVNISTVYGDMIFEVGEVI